jgi:hypothetical protein
MKQQNLKHQVVVIILDFRKAFDTVPHKWLPRKLSLYGLEGEILQWIAASLTDHHQGVLCDTIKST